MSRTMSQTMTRAIPALGIFVLVLCVPADMLPQQTPSPVQSPSQQQAPAAAQRGAVPQSKVQAPLIVHSEAVIVPVTVKDSHGQLVGDLRKDDFRVFEDDVEQQIVLFSSEPVPLSAVVLIDNDLSQKNAGQVQKSLISITAGFGPSDEVALVKYDEFPSTVFDFSPDNDKLFTQLKRVQLGSHSTMITADPTTAGPVINGQKLPDGTGVPLHGSSRVKITTALDDAVYAASQMLKSRGQGRRKIIFLISDGADSGNNSHTFDETLRSLYSADASVYFISVTRSLPLGRALLQRGVSHIERFANQTGGDTFYGAKQADLERLYSDVTEQARNQYTLTFTPQDIDTKQNCHGIEVRVKRPGLSVVARQGYCPSATTVGR